MSILRVAAIFNNLGSVGVYQEEWEQAVSFGNHWKISDMHGECIIKWQEMKLLGGFRLMSATIRAIGGNGSKLKN